MSEEKVGIKETKELLVGVNELSLVMIKHLKDGLQAGKDALAIGGEIMSNDALKAALVAAADGIQKLPVEVKDLDAAEGVELGMVQLGYLPKIIESIKS